MNKIVFPEKKSLSAQNLIDLRNQVLVQPTKPSHQKKTIPDETETEKCEIRQILDDLRSQLKISRIERISARSKAEWLPEQQKVLIQKKVGKFHHFGYSEGGSHYLDNYEALFLIELNRLELFMNSILVSLEQAYLLLLGEARSHHYDRYFVYSTFSRSGYIVQNYQNLDFELVQPSEFDCIWEILRKNIETNYKIPSFVENSTNFTDIRNRFEEIKLQTKFCQQTSKQIESNGIEINFQKKMLGKRKIENKHADDLAHCSKKIKISPDEGCGRSLITILTNQPEFKKFSNFFNEINVIELNSSSDLYQNETEIKIDFDLYLPVTEDGEKYFRKTDPRPPFLRLIVLKSEGIFPSHSQISNCYREQKFKIPLIVVSISESKHCQGFLYYFS